MAWNDVKSSGGDQDRKDIEYFPKGEGTYQGRFLDGEPFSRWTHWIPAANDGKGASVTCIGKDNCPICKLVASQKAKKQDPTYTSRKMHAMNFLMRGKTHDEDKIVVYDKGNVPFGLLAGLNEDVGDLTTYDVKIRVTGKDKNQTHMPIPQQPSKLTDAEKALEKYNFAEMYKELTPDQILTLMAGGSYKEIFKKDDVVATTEEDQPVVDFSK